jgi:hypothetical protein
MNCKRNPAEMVNSIKFSGLPMVMSRVKDFVPMYERRTQVRLSNARAELHETRKNL